MNETTAVTFKCVALYITTGYDFNGTDIVIFLNKKNEFNEIK